MGKTDKDQPGFRAKLWESVRTPSWHTKASRRKHRTREHQDLANGREPSPRYKTDREWYW